MSDASCFSDEEEFTITTLLFNARQHHMDPEGFRYILNQAKARGADVNKVWKEFVAMLEPEEARMLPPFNRIAPKE